MSKIHQSPLLLLAHAASLAIQNRLHFPKDCIGDVVHGEQEDFIIFRRVVITPPADQDPTPGANFVVRFHFSRFAERTNRFLSLIPIPFIVSQPGFRSKTWMIGRSSGIFQGIYEWDSVHHAKRYWNSLPMKLMKQRATPESLYHEVRSL